MMKRTDATKRTCGLAAGLVLVGLAGGLTLTSCCKESTEASCSPTPTATTATTSTKSQPAQAKDAGHGSSLHNVQRIGSKLISGAVPEGDAAFDELKAMGVKAVLSVDGSAPDLARAAARGMRYVHIPITYAEVTPEQQLEIARAVRDLPGPIYLHCHHGKHRGPAAAASAAVLLGEVSASEGVAFMKKAGTAANYKGLYSCVADAAAVSKAAIDAAPAEFPQVRKPAGMTAAMVEVDHAYEHLGHIRDAGWAVPKDHPDLVPASEAGRMTEHLRFSAEDPKAKALGAEFEGKLKAAIGYAVALEEEILRGGKKATLEPLWAPLAASCKDCHVKFRDARVR